MNDETDDEIPQNSFLNLIGWAAVVFGALLLIYFIAR